MDLSDLGIKVYVYKQTFRMLKYINNRTKSHCLVICQTGVLFLGHPVDGLVILSLSPYGAAMEQQCSLSLRHCQFGTFTLSVYLLSDLHFNI